MKKYLNLLVLIGVICCFGMTVMANEVMITSPDKKVEIQIQVEKSLSWSVVYDGNTVLYPSQLGLLFKDQPTFGPMTILKTQTSTIDKTWENKQSKRSLYVDHCTETTISLKEIAKPNRQMELVVRAYNDGLALRYRLPKQAGLENFVLLEDQTEFAFPNDSDCWVSDHKKFNTSQEKPFVQMKITDISRDAFAICPLVIASKQFGYAAVSEADLLSWAGMQFAAAIKQDNEKACTLRLRLTPRQDGNGVVVAKTPIQTPWRVVLLGKKPVDLINNSGIILNVSTPSQIADTDWIHPGTSSWDWWSESNRVINTDTFKSRVDLAHEMGWRYTTLDDPWYYNSMFQRKPGQTVDTTRGCDTIDLDEAFRYAKEKGVKVLVWMHYKDLITCGREKTFKAYEKWGIAGVKIDYMDSDCQETVDWLLETVKIAAKYHLLVNYHGMYKPTGLERTWPNQITREGILGNEYNKFSNLVTPKHCATLPFTRFLAGPGDFTPGGFLNVHPDKFVMQSKLKNTSCTEQGTRAHALAMCLIVDSPILTICDKQGNYQNQPGREFLKNIPPVWDDTMAVDGEIGKYYLLWRRSGNICYAGAITDEQPRELNLKLDFLEKGQIYKAEIFADSLDSTVVATKIVLSEKMVKSGETIKIDMVRNGGWTAIFRPVK